MTDRKRANESQARYYAKNREVILKKNQLRHKAAGGKSIGEDRYSAVFLGCHVAEHVLSNVFNNVVVMPYGNPGYDFICNKGKKVDVKSSCIRNGGGRNKSDYWQFNIKRNGVADYFLIIGFDNRVNLNPIKLWLIPSDKINHLINLSIPTNQTEKWDEFAQPLDKTIKCCKKMKENYI